jgi:hypothetical protein
MRYRSVAGTMAAISLMMAHGAWAGGLGIPLDAFLSQFQLFVIGLGLIIGLVGLAGWITSLMDNPFAHLLAGSVSFFVKAGLLGGGTVMLGSLGLIAGGSLP